MHSGRKAPIVDGATNESFGIDSPRSVEACRRRGLDVSDLEERSEEFFRRRPPGKGYGKEAPAIRKERHEVNRHRLLREVSKERLTLIREGRSKNDIASEPRRSSTPSPYSPSRAVRHDKGSGSASAPANGGKKMTASRGGANPVLEAEAQRLAMLKRRQAMELKHMLTFELRCIAREERDRRRAEKAYAREATAEARREEMLKQADRARFEREQLAQARDNELKRVEAEKRARQAEAKRRFEAEDQLRQRQAELAMQRRAEQAAEKAAVLNNRIARGARVRRARQLRNERIAAKKADERDAVAEAAKRTREAESAARTTAAVARAVAARAAVEEARRQREEKEANVQATAEERVAELEGRAELFRRRKKEIAERERVLREENAADTARQRRDTTRRNLELEAKRRSDQLEIKALREKQLELALEVRREQEAARRQKGKRDKEEQLGRALERRRKVEEKRCEATKKKIEEDAAKVDLLRSEKERGQAHREKLCSETAKQREALKEHFEALKEHSDGGITFDAIAAAVSSVAATEGNVAPPGISHTPRAPFTDGRGAKSKQRQRKPGASCTSQALNEELQPIKAGTAEGPGTHRCNRACSAIGVVRKQSGHVKEPGACEKVEDLGGSQNGIQTLACRPQSLPSPPSTASSLTLPSGAAGAKTSRGLTRMVKASEAAENSAWKHGRNSSRSLTPRGTSPSRETSPSKVDAVDELRRRYDNQGSSSPLASLLREAKKARKKGKATSTAYTGGSGSGGNGRSRISPRAERHLHGDHSPGQPESARRGKCPDDDTGLPQISRIEGGAAWEGGDVGSQLLPLTSSDLLRRRYDLELLAVLEEEQKAEGARERVLAAAKARATTAQARVRHGNKIASAPGASATHVVVDDDFHGDEADKSQRNAVLERGNDIRDQGLPKGQRATTVKAGAGGAPRGARADDRRRREEAEIATRMSKRLEEELARERREASERVLRVSEAYESALKKLSKQTEKEQAQHPAAIRGE